MKGEISKRFKSNLRYFLALGRLYFDSKWCRSVEPVHISRRNLSTFQNATTHSETDFMNVHQESYSPFLLQDL